MNAVVELGQARHQILAEVLEAKPEHRAELLKIFREGQRALWAGKVDQHIGVGDRLAHIGRHGNTRGLAQKGASIGAQAGVARSIERAGQPQIGAGQHGFDQHLAHAAAGARNGNADGR